MSDSKSAAVQGRTRWRRFGLAIVPVALAAGGIILGLADGALAASISISGESFKVSADQLTGGPFLQYGGGDIQHPSNYGSQDPLNGTVPVAISEIGTAHLSNMCQSVKIGQANDPTGLLAQLTNGLFGGIVLKITAGDNGTAAQADNLRVDMSQLSGDATFHGLQIGVDARDFGRSDAVTNQSGINIPGGLNAGTNFAQSATDVTIDNLQQTAYATTAGTFYLPHMHLQIITHANSLPHAGECF